MNELDKLKIKILEYEVVFEDMRRIINDTHHEKVYRINKLINSVDPMSEEELGV